MRETRQKFVAAYDAKHRIAMEGDDKAVMVIGQEDFPLPIPLVAQGWHVALRHRRGP